jgi:GT2 family glycosyltransferase
MAKQDRIGVVTVTYNSADVLPAFLRCVMDQTHREFLLFAVDNASKDDTLKLLGACADERLRIIANPDNRGVAAGNNQGILAALEAGCSSVLLLNNDTEFDAGLFAQLDAELDRGRAEMVCPKILYYDEPERIWAAGGKFVPWLGYRSVHHGEGQVDLGQHDEVKFVTYVPTCCVLIRKEVFRTVGLMDERYFVYADDMDFMYRAMKVGIRLIYLPGSKLLHKVGRLTGGPDSPFAIRYGTRNRLYFLLKHFGVARSLPCLIICQTVWTFRAFGRKNGEDWLKIKRAALRESLLLLKASKL